MLFNSVGSARIPHMGQVGTGPRVPSGDLHAYPLFPLSQPFPGPPETSGRSLPQT